MRLIQSRVAALPANLSSRVQHVATDSPYCHFADGDGDWFSISIDTGDGRPAGQIDGIFNCGQHVWGPIEVKGIAEKNVAVVQFDAAFAYGETQAAEVLIFVFKDTIYWRVLSEVHVQSYVPASEILPSEPSTSRQ